MKTDTLCLRAACDQAVTERPRYFPRQLITPDDLTLEQDYFRSRLRWHNRMLHGWGVVCGAKVCLVPKTGNGGSAEPWKVAVKPGYILGPYGDEINIDCTRIVDLRTKGVTGITGDPCVEAIDPWCSEVIEHRDAGAVYVAVRYKEVPTRPVRVQPVGCGCEDTACEYSRVRDGYEICILNECPDSDEAAPKPDDLFKGDILDCIPCPEDPWVVLAAVTVNKDGKITKIDNCACRRMVASLADFWWRCEEKKTEPSKDKVKVEAVNAPERELEPGKDYNLRVVGSRLNTVLDISFGEGVKVVKFKADPAGTELAAAVQVSATATPGPRTLAYKTSDGAQGEFPSAIIIARQRLAPTPAPKGATRRGKGKESEGRT